MDEKSKSQLTHAKEDIEPKLAGLQALVATTTDAATRDVIQDEYPELATKLSKVNAALASLESSEQALADVKDIKSEKIAVSEEMLAAIGDTVKNIQAAFALFEKKVEKEQLKEDTSASSPAPGPAPTSASTPSPVRRV